MRHDYIRNIKFIPAGILTLSVCFYLNAEEAVSDVIYYGNAEIAGAEYLFDASDSTEPDSTSAEHGKQAKLTSEESQYIYVAENAEIYSEEPLFVKADTSTNVETKAGKIKKAVLASKPAENKIIQQEPIACVFPTFPLELSSSSFSQVGSKSAAITFQYKIGNNEQSVKAYRKISHKNVTNPNLLIYKPKQRQNLSITATQCGELTSFGSQSPPVLLIELSSHA